MPATIVEGIASESHRKPRLTLRNPWCLVPSCLITAGVLGYSVLLILNWPFTRQSLIDALQQATLRSVTIDRFQPTFFPPGCIAEGIRFERHQHKNKPPIIEIKTLTLHGSYWGLATAQHKLHFVKVDQMHVTVPPARVHGQPDPIMPLNRVNPVHPIQIDKIVADGAVLDFAHEDGSTPYRATVDKLTVHNIRPNSPITYNLVLSNSLPRGKIYSNGVFGPWDTKIPGNTPVHGSYTYKDADLSTLQDLNGVLQGGGSFQGRLGEIRTVGSVDVSQFHLDDTGHARDLKARFQARVDGTKGNTILDELRASFDRSVLLARGAITGDEGQEGKTVSLDLFCPSGRIEDVLRLFIRAKRSPLVGGLRMQAHIDVPPGGAPFVQRMQMRGEFGVTRGSFTDETTQEDLNRLARSSKDHDSSLEDGVTALSDVRGHGEIRGGVATLRPITFAVPGATANMNGTYSLLDYQVDLHGRLYTDGRPSSATTGFKAWVLRAITPFLKKKGDTRIVPFKISGDYNKTKVALDLAPKEHSGALPEKPVPSLRTDK